jgi:hypothetical protein
VSSAKEKPLRFKTFIHGTYKVIFDNSIAQNRRVYFLNLYTDPNLSMKKLTVLILAIVAVATMLYAGFDGLTNNYAYGPFITFIGCCTAIGVTIDLFNHFQSGIRKRILRKLGR